LPALFLSTRTRSISLHFTQFYVTSRSFTAHVLRFLPPGSAFFSRVLLPRHSRKPHTLLRASRLRFLSCVTRLRFRWFVHTFLRFAATLPPPHHGTYLRCPHVHAPSLRAFLRVHVRRFGCCVRHFTTSRLQFGWTRLGSHTAPHSWLVARCWFSPFHTMVRGFTHTGWVAYRFTWFALRYSSHTFTTYWFSARAYTRLTRRLPLRDLVTVYGLHSCYGSPGFCTHTHAHYAHTATGSCLHHTPLARVAVWLRCGSLVLYTCTVLCTSSPLRWFFRLHYKVTPFRFLWFATPHTIVTRSRFAFWVSLVPCTSFSSYAHLTPPSLSHVSCTKPRVYHAHCTYTPHRLPRFVLYACAVYPAALLALLPLRFTLPLATRVTLWFVGSHTRLVRFTFGAVRLFRSLYRASSGFVLPTRGHARFTHFLLPVYALLG